MPSPVKIGKVDLVGASIGSESSGPTHCDAFGSMRNDRVGKVGLGSPKMRERDIFGERFESGHRHGMILVWQPPIQLLVGTHDRGCSMRLAGVIFRCQC